MSLLYYTSGITLALDASRCTGCGRCVDVCPHGVFELIKSEEGSCGCGGKTPRTKAVIAHRERCMECGACGKNCAVGAITAKSGVGCATAIITGMFRGTAPECGCGDGGCCGENKNEKKGVI